MGQEQGRLAVDVILALDPAKKTGFALGVPGKRPMLATINFARELDDPADVFARALKWVERVLDGSFDDGAGKPTLLGIEAPVPPSKNFGATQFDTTQIALGLSAIFRGAARARGLPIKLAPINSWRKYALGSGRLKGVEAKRRSVRLCRSLGWGDVDHNAAEAGMIFLWASGQINPQLTTRPEPLFSGAML